jgi:hypothetical protein
VPSRISPVDPAARYTSAQGGQAQFCYATNYLVDVKHAVIVDVEATTAVRQAEVTAAKRMIERAHDDLGLWPRKLIADTGYGSAEMLAWLVDERAIEPHILRLRQVRSHGRHLLAKRLCLRSSPRCLHLSRRQAPEAPAATVR